MFSITADQLRSAAPRCPNPAKWASALTDAMMLYGIAADLDYMVEFLAQCAHESGEFTRLEENLWYTADRLMAVWPKRFPTMQVAALYAGQPHKLADFVYSNRMGNGDAASHDGWNYRGRGAIMTTGLDAYRKLAKMTGDPLLITCPQRLCTVPTAAISAAAWWAADPRLNALADDTATDDDAADLVSITRIVNGGTTGIVARQRLRTAFSAALRGR